MKNSVEVLLREHVRDLGRCGDVVRVAPGYARNYLLPRRLAVPATADNTVQMKRRASRLAAEDALQSAEIAARVAALSALRVTTRQKADENGHLYGSVSAALLTELCSAAGAVFEERDVRLDAPIKSVGEHKVRLHVHGETHAENTVIVQAEG